MISARCRRLKVVVMLKFSFSTQKMKAGDLARAKGHNTRTHETQSQLPRSAWIHPKGHHQIIAWNDKRALWARSLSTRKDAVVGIEMTFQVGSQFDWRDKPTKEHPYGKLKKPPVKLADMAKAVQRFLVSEFGKENIVALALHLDESSPHFHAVVIPATTDDGGPKLQAKKWLDGRARIGSLYERAHKAVSATVECSYTKGNLMSGAKHKPALRAGHSEAVAAELRKDEKNYNNQIVFSADKIRASFAKKEEELTAAVAERDRLKKENEQLRIAQKELSDELFGLKSIAPHMPLNRMKSAIEKEEKLRQEEIKNGIKDREEELAKKEQESRHVHAAPRRRRRHSHDDGYNGPK